MTRYLVFEPPETIEPSGAAVFLRDRFSFFAFFFTFLWMFRYGLWLSGVVTIAAFIALNQLGTVEGFEWSAALISLLFGVLIGLEGPSLRASKLRRKGWNEVAAFEAQNTGEAEIIYYYSAPAALSPPPPPPLDDIEVIDEDAVTEPDEPKEPEELARPTQLIASRSGDDDRSAASETTPANDADDRFATEIERTARVEGWAERWDRPGAEYVRLPGVRRKPVGRL
ncbi:DUF2628 domain-containing protein [Jiella endophytica]|nr:DUF2628 domain-containing protein [Jiella endophytica]